MLADPEEYQKHKLLRFAKVDFEIPIASNEAFLLSDAALRERFKIRYKKTASLYYKGQPDFETVLARIHEFMDSL